MFHLSLFVVFCALLTALTLDYLRNRRKWKMIEKLPGLKPRYLFGNVPVLRIMRSNNLQTSMSMIFQAAMGVSQIFSEQGLFRFWLGRRPFVVLTKVETAEVVLSSQVSIGKADIYKIGQEWTGEGLANSSGDVWRHDRRILTPAFSVRILEDFLPIMNEHAAVLTRKTTEDAVGRPWFDLQEHVQLCTLDIILESSMGFHAGALENNHLYTSLVQRITQMLLKRAVRPWLHNNFVYNLTPTGRDHRRVVGQLNDMTAQIIEKRRLERGGKTEVEPPTGDLGSTPGGKRLALLDLLLEAGLGEKQLREQVSTFVFAGHHTITTSLMWTLYVIGLYPRVQDKLVEEVDTLFGQDVTRDVTQDDLKNLKYMDRVMKETQRIYPAAPVIARKLAEDTEIGGHVIPAGTECIISIATIHLDKQVYPDPQKFDPDRFLPENSVGRHPHSLIPFSAGPRNCIGQRYAGMEMKVILCHLIRSLSFRSLDPRDKVNVTPGITLTPLRPLRIEIAARKLNSFSNPVTNI